MPVVVIEPPTAILTADEVVAALGITGEQSYLELLIAAAQQLIDGPTGTLGRAIGQQVLELRVDCFPFGSMYSQPGSKGFYPHMWSGSSHYYGLRNYDIVLPYPPVISVDSVIYVDDSGDPQTMVAGDYRLVGAPDQPRLTLSFGASWPRARYQEEAVAIQYHAGYVDIPAALKRAILVLVKAMDSENFSDPFLRGETVDGVGSQQYAVGDVGKVAIDQVETLIGPFRLPSF